MANTTHDSQTPLINAPLSLAADPERAPADSGCGRPSQPIHSLCPFAGSGHAAGKAVCEKCQLQTDPRRLHLNRFPTWYDKEWKIVGWGASSVITAKRHSSSPLRVVGGCLAAYALLATGYQYFLEPVTAGNAAVSKAIPQRVVEAIAPAAAPSTVVPPPPAVELPRSNGAPMRRDAVSGGESPSTEATSREPPSPVASEFTALAPEPTETPAAEKPKRPTKQAVRSRGQPRNPLELALRPFSALRLPF